MVRVCNALSSTDLRQVLATAFDECQSSTYCHRKHALQIKKLLPTLAGRLHDFEQIFIQMLVPLISVKRKEPTIERSIKFVASLIGTLQQTQSEGSFDTLVGVKWFLEPCSDEENQLVAFILKYLTKGLSSKDKHVRYRCAQIFALCIDSIDEMEFVTSVFRLIMVIGISCMKICRSYWWNVFMIKKAQLEHKPLLHCPDFK